MMIKIRFKICSFYLDKVKGSQTEYYCHRPGLNTGAENYKRRNDQSKMNLNVIVVLENVQDHRLGSETNEANKAVMKISVNVKCLK